MPKSMDVKRLLLIFLKNAEIGKVKTRLAASAGDQKALEIYKRLLRHTRHAVQPLQIRKQLWYANFIPERDDWPEEKFEKRVQKGDDLGRRMQFAFEDGFKSGFEQIVIIGTDCPQLKTEHVEKAFKALNGSEAVVGPAKDGGYYLLGLNKTIPRIFENKRWSTSSVFDETVADFKNQHISFQRLEELRDVDTEEDWNKVKGNLGKGI